MKIVMTGGHHSSAVPVIDKLKERYPNAEIFWLGHRHSLKGDKNDTLEYKEITSKNIPFYELHAGKVYRIFDPVRLLRVPLGFFEAFILLLKLHPDVIMSFGGYLAVPVVVMGTMLGIPVVTHEQTVVTGYANKVISYFAKKILLSWKTSEKFFPKAKTVFSGIPLRKSIFTVSSNEFVFDNDLPVLYVTAGKTGSHTINTVILRALKDLLGFTNIIHQCGDYSQFTDHADLVKEYDHLKDLPGTKGKYYARKFIFDNEIGEAFSKASIVLARSGAHTISELIALEKPAVLIPLPNTSHNEQERNAEYLRDSGLGVIVLESELTPEHLTSVIKTALGNLSGYCVRPGYTLDRTLDASEVIVNELIKAARKKE